MQDRIERGMAGCQKIAAAATLAAPAQEFFGTALLILCPCLYACVCRILEPLERLGHDGAVKATKSLRFHGAALAVSNASRRASLRRMMSCRRRSMGKFQIKGMASIWKALGTTQNAMTMPRFAKSVLT